MNTRHSTDSINRKTLAKLQRLSDLMDSTFTVPGTHIRFGFDSIVGLIPVVGDTLTAGVSWYIYSFAKKAGVPGHKRMLMVWNIFIDWLIGLIPLVGDVFDVAFKANRKNVRIIMAHVESQSVDDINNGDDRHRA